MNISTSIKMDSNQLYVFAWSWQPEFCYKKTTYPGCVNPDSPSWNKVFTIHGLWPQYKSGGYPSDCTNEAFDETIPYMVGWNQMINNWPEVEYGVQDPNYSSFWIHEWSKVSLFHYNFKNHITNGFIAWNMFWIITI